MSGTANLLAVSPEIRETFLEWNACQRYRIERGYMWAEAAHRASMDRMKEMSRDADTARKTLALP